jgi:hypothetical protein
MPSRIDNVPLERAYEVLDRAAQHVRNARGDDPIVSRQDMRDYLAGLPDGKERALATLFYKFIDHRDAGKNARVTDEDIDGTLAYAKARLLRRLDANEDGALSNQEIAGISRIGRLAFEIAKEAQGPAPGPCPVLGYGAALDQAIADGRVAIEGNPCDIRSAKVKSDGEHQDVSDLLSAMLQLEGSDKLERLNVGLISQWDGNDTYAEALGLLAADGQKPGLKDVFVGDFTQDESEISWVDIGDVSALYAATPNLENLKVRGGGIGLGDLRLPKLESLVIESGGLPAGAIASVDRAELPKLRKLELWFGSSEYGAEGNAGMLAGLMGGAGYPELRDLGVRNSEFTDQIVAALVNAPILSQLERLDLSMGTLTDAGAAVLAANVEKLRHLKKIDVDDNYLSEAGIRTLRDAFGRKVNIGVQDKLDPDNPNDRYVSVGE